MEHPSITRGTRASALSLAHALQRRWSDGLPTAYDVMPDVSALTWYDPAVVDGALRSPQRVTVRPETERKGYPVLAFVRGDVQVILGAQKRPPAVLAVYVSSLLQHDTHRPFHSGGVAGATTRHTNAPRTPSALLRRLIAEGATCVPSADDRSVTVTYRGAEIGNVPTRCEDRQLVATTWKKLQRRMAAVA